MGLCIDRWPSWITVVGSLITTKPSPKRKLTDSHATLKAAITTAKVGMSSITVLGKVQLTAVHTDGFRALNKKKMHLL